MYITSILPIGSKPFMPTSHSKNKAQKLSSKITNPTLKTNHPTQLDCKPTPNNAYFSHNQKS